MRYRIYAVVLLLVAMTGALARTGVVHTVSGEQHAGHVRFTADGLVVANAVLGVVRAVPLSNVLTVLLSTNLPGPAPAETKNTAPERTDWRNTQIGPARKFGSARFEPGRITVRGDGLNIDAESDSFHFVYKPVRGDHEIVARVSLIQYTHPSAKAGLMMRESTSEYSRYAMVAITAQRGGAFQARYAEGRTTQSVPQPELRPPYWLKLRRRGEEFYGFASVNGHQWTLIERTQLSMGEEIYVGMAVCSARPGMLNWTTFDHLRDGPRLRNEFTPVSELTSGSLVKGWPVRADAREFQYAGPQGFLRVPASRVARVIFQPLTTEWWWKTQVSRPGVWVSNGDFYDAEFQRIDRNALRVSSVLYGLRSFDLNDEVLAAVLHARRPMLPRFEVLTTDSSRLFASALTLGEGEVRLTEPALGEMKIPSYRIAEIRQR